MPFNTNRVSGGALARRKRALLASAFALGLGGLVAGEAMLSSSTDAQAQVTQVQNLSQNNNLRDEAPRQQQISFADVVETVKPAVLSVRVKTSAPDNANAQSQMPGFFRDLPEGHPLRRFFDEFGRPNGGDQGQGPGPQRRGPRQFGMAQGSGFFISADGYAVTNNHVVENANEVEVGTDDGKTYKARVIGTDPRTDLALLKVDDVKDLKFVSFGPQSPRVGDWVVAIGNPFGLGGSVTAGIVSARGRDIGAGPYDDFLQIDAAVNRGNSGGPTFNLRGEVVGVNTAIYSPSGGNVGIAFAVPSEVATRVIDELRQSGSVTRGWLGIQIQPVSEEIADSLGLKEPKGALVVEPQPGSPGQKAGIQAGDVVLNVDGHQVEDARDLSRTIAGLKPNTKVNITLWRAGAEKKVTVDLGTLPAENQQASNRDTDRGTQSEPETTPPALADLGLTLQSASRVSGAGSDGVVVSDISENSGVSEKLRVGDVILEVGGTKVSTPRDVGDAFQSAREKGTRSVLMRVRTGDNTRYVAVPVSRG
ncbi:Do family serine endopeptidase [Terrihabitans rhizophilus]|jgi:serine protease Do|uniref:Probable periplasmic serine endoprotease DegP-like n=1 Tax=Terrihabitans rhizophilus TaxID=3092662 RepID=A0ABU4RP30_9HYPH|nr:Do family serine endopeptidase [Terrihabitans sp. PJ23]MDX6806582.1 Do family serine endopeptidase [Terrihabitans sp. PJ23]